MNDKTIKAVDGSPITINSRDETLTARKIVMASNLQEQEIWVINDIKQLHKIKPINFTRFTQFQSSLSHHYCTQKKAVVINKFHKINS